MEHSDNQNRKKPGPKKKPEEELKMSGSFFAQRKMVRTFGEAGDDDKTRWYKMIDWLHEQLAKRS